jgi:hypothetical protein
VKLGGGHVAELATVTQVQPPTFNSAVGLRR